MNLTVPGIEAAPEREIARDLVLRGLLIGPAFLVLFGITHGLHGVVSSAYALALVLANFAAGAALITWAVRVSPQMLYGMVLGGYVVRLAAITAAVLPVRDLAWFEMVPFAATLIVAHLGLLIWETRHVAASLAYPGLEPGGALFVSGPHQGSEE